MPSKFCFGSHDLFFLIRRRKVFRFFTFQAHFKHSLVSLQLTFFSSDILICFSRFSVLKTSDYLIILWTTSRLFSAFKVLNSTSEIELQIFASMNVASFLFASTIFASTLHNFLVYSERWVLMTFMLHSRWIPLNNSFYLDIKLSSTHWSSFWTTKMQF